MHIPSVRDRRIHVDLGPKQTILRRCLFGTHLFRSLTYGCVSSEVRSLSASAQAEPRPTSTILMQTCCKAIINYTTSHQGGRDVLAAGSLGGNCNCLGIEMVRSRKNPSTFSKSSSESRAALLSRYRVQSPMIRTGIHDTHSWYETRYLGTSLRNDAGLHETEGWRGDLVRRWRHKSDFLPQIVLYGV